MTTFWGFRDTTGPTLDHTGPHWTTLTLHWAYTGPTLGPKLSKWPKCVKSRENGRISWKCVKMAEFHEKVSKWPNCLKTKGNRGPDPYHGYHARSAPWPGTPIPRVPTTRTTTGSIVSTASTASHRPTTVHQASFGYSEPAKIPLCLKLTVFIGRNRPVKTANFPKIDRKREPKFDILPFLTILTVFGQFWHFSGHLWF